MAAAGCSSFHKEWKTAARRSPTGGIEGRWDGSWRSESNGHKGRLRCLIRKVDDVNYAARFRANYWKIFTFGYTVPLAVRGEPGVFKFSGQADLGKLAGGVYHYEGEATSDRFLSTYICARDRGVFEMKRPPADE